MYISGLHGYNFDQASTAMPDYGIFHQVEWATNAAGSRGTLAAWDTVDNTAVTGIMRSTYGLRVIVHPVLSATTTPNPNRPAGFLVADVAAPAATPASSRGPLIIVQAYGPHGRLLSDTTAAGDMIKGGHIVPTTATAGQVSGPEDNAALTDNERLNSVGFSYEVVAAGGAAGVPFQGFVSCLAAK